MSTATAPVLPGAPTAIKIFGREPAMILALIEAILSLLVVFSLGVDSELAGVSQVLISAVIGVYIAWATKATLLGAVLAAVKALFAFLIYFKATLTPDQMAAVLAAVPVALAMWQRTQTSPVAEPLSPSPAQVVLVPPTGDVAQAVADDPAIPGATLPADPDPLPYERVEYDGHGAPIIDGEAP